MKELTTKKQAKLLYYGTSLVAQTVKASAYNVGDPVSIPGLERFPWRRKRQPTPVFLPENPVDGGAWQATVHGVAESRTRLSNFTSLANQEKVQLSKRPENRKH